MTAHLEAAGHEQQAATATTTYLERDHGGACATRCATTSASSCSARTSATSAAPFGVTEGLLEEFGADRVIDTPIAEEGFVGAAIGAAWMGERPVVELQFADFVTLPVRQIVTVAAKTHWRSGIRLPLVIRAPSGGGVRGGPFHAGSPEGWFVGVPGLKVVCPGTVADAYGLLRSAIEDDDPVLFFEHKGLYRRLRGEPPGAGARVRRSGARTSPATARDATVVTYGCGRRRSRSTPSSGSCDVEVLDLRTRLAARRGRRARVGRDGRRGSSCCRRPRARPAPPATCSRWSRARASSSSTRRRRCVAPPDTPVPFAPELEDAYLPSVDVDRAALEELLAY